MLTASLCGLACVLSLPPSKATEMATPAPVAALAALLCANCDEAEPAFACRDCPACLTPACTACSIALHKPHRTRRHRLRMTERQRQRQLQRQSQLSSNTEEESEAAATEGHGFCDACIKRIDDGADDSSNSSSGRIVMPRLAVLECEGCTPASGIGGNVSLCMTCDQSVHQSLCCDAHTRLFFSEDDDEDDDRSEEGQAVRAAAALASCQQNSFVLAGTELRLKHQDSMPSYAGRIWPGSMMLARYCEQKERQQPGFWKDKKILELGCGCKSLPARPHTALCNLRSSKLACKCT